MSSGSDLLESTSLAYVFTLKFAESTSFAARAADSSSCMP